jgi:small subunit ribosomal protein S16
MSLRIRLARSGAKKRPFYRIIVANASSPRDGRFIERLGSYNPLLSHDHPTRLVLDHDRVNYWLGVGAQPTDRVALFLGQKGLIAMPDQKNQTKKSMPKKKAQERMKAASK